MEILKHPSTLTKDQIEFYKENGYILIKNLVSHDLLDTVKQRFIDICQNPKDYAVNIVMEDLSLKAKGAKGEYLIIKIQDFPEEKVLSKYLEDEKILNIVEDLIGPNITTTHSMFINKPPDVDPETSLHPLHQDLYYFPFRPADSIVASWTAVERVHVDNGCLFIIPGSHREPLHVHSYPKGKNLKMYHGIYNLDHLPKTYVEMEKGDTIFFHPLLLHGSGPNRTKGFRKAISSHYADSNCYFIDVKGTVQNDIGKEVIGLVKKRGIDITYEDVWKSKSKLVRGKPGNFQLFNANESKL